MNLDNVSPSKIVKITFPPDSNKIAEILDWLYNSGEFMTVHMDMPTINKLRQITGVEIIES